MAVRGRKNANEALALALAAGRTVAEAAQQVGVGERTAYRRLDDPAFRRRIAELRAEMIGRALGRMADGMSEAAVVLRELLAAGSDNVKLGAARSLLELTVKLRESTELEQRLQDLESRLPAQGNQR